MTIAGFSLSDLVLIASTLVSGVTQLVYLRHTVGELSRKAADVHEWQAAADRRLYALEKEIDILRLRMDMLTQRPT
jgi:hypothetical protein